MFGVTLRRIRVTIVAMENQQVSNTVCPTPYRTQHFFNNSDINEDIATKFEQEYVRCVRNEEERACNAPNCCDTVKLLKKCRVR